MTYITKLTEMNVFLKSCRGRLKYQALPKLRQHYMLQSRSFPYMLSAVLS